MNRDAWREDCEFDELRVEDIRRHRGEFVDDEDDEEEEQMDDAMLKGLAAGFVFAMCVTIVAMVVA